MLMDDVTWPQAFLYGVIAICWAWVLVKL